MEQVPKSKTWALGFGNVNNCWENGVFFINFSIFSIEIHSSTLYLLALDELIHKVLPNTKKVYLKVQKIMSALANIHQPIKLLNTKFPRGRECLCLFLPSLLCYNSSQQKFDL